MRKFSLLLVVLLAAGSAGLYGQMAINTDFSITGDATATLGYNLDLQKFGFKNAMSSNIRLELVPKQNSSNPADMGMDASGWIGVIELKDFRIIIDNEYDDDDADTIHEAGAKTEGETSAASGGQTHLGAGHTHVPAGEAGDGSVVYVPWEHAHDGSVTVDVGQDNVHTLGSLANDSTFQSHELETLDCFPATPRAVGDPYRAAQDLMCPPEEGIDTSDRAPYQISFNVFRELTHMHVMPTVGDTHRYGAPEDDTETTEVDESRQTGPGVIQVPTEACDITCLEKDGNKNIARTGISQPATIDGTASIAVPSHYHDVVGLNSATDTDLTTYDMITIRGSSPELVMPSLHPHTHNTTHSHDGHTHPGHAHKAQAHDSHAHFGNVVVTNPSVTAKLKNGPLSIKIYSAPGNKAGLVGAVENNKPAPADGIDDKAHKAESADDANDVHIDLGGHGITLGYDDGGLSVSVGISSDETYDSTKDGGFVVSGSVGVDVGPAEVDLEVVQGIQSRDADNVAVGRNQTGFGGKISTDMGISGFSLWVGADVVMTGDGDRPPTAAATSHTTTLTTTGDAAVTTAPTTECFVLKNGALAPCVPPTVAVTYVEDSLEWEIGAGIEVELPTDSDAKATLSADYIYSTKQNVASDLKVEFADDGAFIENLKWSLAWGLFDITNGWAASTSPTENDQMDMLLKGKLSYGFADTLGGTLTPGVSVTMNKIDDDDAIITTEVQMVLTEAIPQAEIGLKWKSESLFEADDGNPDNDLGVLTAWTKVKY